MNAGNTYGGSKEFYDSFKRGTEKSLEIANNVTPKRQRTFAGDKNNGMDRYLSYPIARSMQEKTGDTLQIKCVEFIPPENGATMGMQVENLFHDVTLKDGTVKKNYIMSQKEREDFNTRNPNSPIGEPSLNFEFSNATTRHKDRTTTKYYIELPMPQELNDSNSVTWGDDRVNAIELAGLAVAQQMMKDGVVGSIDNAQKAIRALNAGIKIPNLTEDTQNAIRAAISGAAVGQLGGNISAQSVVTRATGQILNNNLELLFKGVNLRSFPYSITFSPRNPKEARVVKSIIRSLKMSMAAKAGEFNGGAQGIFLKSPDVFQLRYLRDGRDHPFLNNFKLCALTGLNLNYTNAGTYSSYEDGTPVNIRMDVTFKEINPIYFEDYLPGNGTGDGVGY